LTGWRATRSRRRLVGMGVLGVVAAVVAGVLGSWSYAPLVGWDVAVLVFSGWVWATTARMDAPTTQAHATAEDPARASSDLIVLAAAVASLAAVGVVLVKASSAKGLTQGLLAGLGVASVALSWFTVHTLFMLRYAMLYYGDPGGGIDFNQDEKPVYSDFAYHRSGRTFHPGTVGPPQTRPVDHPGGFPSGGCRRGDPPIGGGGESAAVEGGPFRVVAGSGDHDHLAGAAVGGRAGDR